MSYQLKVIKDYPIGFWPLDESSGTTASDISGCGNNATYVGSPAANMLPIIPGGGSGTKITNTAYITVLTSKDFYGSSVSNGLANKYSSDNDFTIELWISPSIQSSNLTTLFADTTDGIGLYWEKGDIVFKVSATEQIRWAVTYSKKAIHVVGVYSVNSIILYIDGTRVAFKSIDTGFKFTNTSFDLQIGPTSDAGDSFVVDAPAVYRYGLNAASITRHYNDANYYIQPIHVVNPEDGVLFSCSDRTNIIDFGYTYGVDTAWDNFVDSNTYYNDNGNYIAFIPTDTTESKSFVINDFLFVPMESGLTNSKIEWRNELGIVVETSVDGTNYLTCVNGESIPQYKSGAFNTSGLLYIRITMSTTDASKFLPRLSYFSIRFYTQSRIYADNFNSYIESDNQFAVGSLNYSPLLRHYNNGIRPNSGYGFKINTGLNINTVEMFFTPKTTGANTLFYDPTTSTKYAWNGSGVVSKASINKVYVNGVDKTSQTNISNFLVAGEPHHIVLVFSSAVTGNLQFNYESSGGPDNLYNNIAIYNRAFTETDADTHFDLYCGRPTATIIDPVIDLTELPAKYYDNDWIVLQSI
jgi:hypothetical protein